MYILQNGVVDYMLNDGHGIFGVIFFCGVLGQPLTFAPFCEKKESLLHRSTDKIVRHAVLIVYSTYIGSLNGFGLNYESLLLCILGTERDIQQNSFFHHIFPDSTVAI